MRAPARPRVALAGLAALAGLGVSWSVAAGALATPAILDTLEHTAGRPLSYEESVRSFILTALLLFVLAWSAFLLFGLTITRLCAWLGFLAGSAGVAVICLVDRNYPLAEEFSWIRYVTALFLVTSGVLAGVVGKHYARRERAGIHAWLWAALTVAFVGLALDELLMLHEAVGGYFEQRLGASKMFTDFLTMAYAFGALTLVAVALSTRSLVREYVTHHRGFVVLFASGALVFLTSQVFDTFDFWVSDRLRALALARSADAELWFSDLWYPAWGPKQLLNDVEEALECIASALLLAGFALISIEKLRPGLRHWRTPARPRAAFAILTALGFGTLATGLWLATGREITAPAIGHTARLVLGPRDGLLHTDVVFYHPNWGLLVANEGRGNVIQHRDGRTRELPDPRGLVTDTDCVTAIDDAVYVSSPSLRTVFEYTDESGFRPFSTAADGLLKPEALVVANGVLYVADETFHRIYAIDLATRAVDEMRLEDPRWASPEGIAYHPGLDRLLITDDETGYIATVAFDGSAAVFAAPEDGLANPEDLCVTRDGRVFVVDNGRREVIEFAQDGRVLDRIRFHRMYGYLVGIAVVEGGPVGQVGGATDDDGPETLYVVASDGFASVSFMPSFLWELRRPRPRVR